MHFWNDTKLKKREVSNHKHRYRWKSSEKLLKILMLRLHLRLINHKFWRKEKGSCVFKALKVSPMWSQVWDTEVDRNCTEISNIIFYLEGHHLPVASNESLKWDTFCSVNHLFLLLLKVIQIKNNIFNVKFYIWFVFTGKKRTLLSTKI